MSIKTISPMLEKMLLTSLASAADYVSAKIIAEGVPTTEIMNELIKEALEEAASGLSQKGADMLTVEALQASDSKKISFGIFLGMIKGKCVTLGMRARNVYDLELLLKSIAPIEAFVFGVAEAMKVVKPTLASLPTKISAALSSYLSPAGITKAHVLEIFSKFDEGLLMDIELLVRNAVKGVLDELEQPPSGQ